MYRHQLYTYIHIIYFFFLNKFIQRLQLLTNHKGISYNSWKQLIQLILNKLTQLVPIIQLIETTNTTTTTHWNH